MGFFDFDEDFSEAAPASKPATTSRNAAAPRPAATARPAATTARPAATPRPATASRPATTSRPAPAPAPRPAPAPTASRPASSSKPSFNFDQFKSTVGKGLDFAKWGVGVGTQIAQVAQQFQRPPAGAPSPAPMDPIAPVPTSMAPMPAPSEPPGALAPPATVDPAAAAPAAPPSDPSALATALQARQIPALPGAPPPADPMAPLPAPAPGPQPDALALLRVILSNPQFRQALMTPQSAAPPPRAIALPVPAPAPAPARSVSVPLAAVMNAIAALAGQTTTELNESTAEDDPELPSYLVGDDGDFIVDPADPDRRAALVTHLFRMSESIQRADGLGPRVDGQEFDEAELDVEAWPHAGPFGM